MPRHFPTPWTAEETNDACFIVRDATGTKLAYVYYGDGGSEAVSLDRLTRSEAGVIARGIVRLANEAAKRGA